MRGPPTVPARPSGRTARSIKQAVRDLPGAQINRPARRRRADARPQQIRGKRSFGRFYLGPLQGRPSARSQPYRRRGLPGRRGTRLAPEGARTRGRVPSKRPGNAVPEDAKMAPDRGRTGERVSGLESRDRFATANSVKRATSTVHCRTLVQRLREGTNLDLHEGPRYRAKLRGLPRLKLRTDRAFARRTRQCAT